MKLVFSKEEVATALDMNVNRFDELRPVIEAEGFPKPLPGLDGCWSILEVIDWVNRSKTPVEVRDVDEQRQAVVVSLHGRLKGSQ